MSWRVCIVSGHQSFQIDTWMEFIVGCCSVATVSLCISFNGVFLGVICYCCSVLALVIVFSFSLLLKWFFSFQLRECVFVIRCVVDVSFKYISS